MFSTSPRTSTQPRRRSRPGGLLLAAVLTLALALGGAGFAAGQASGKKKDVVVPTTLDSGATTSTLRYVTYNIRAKLTPAVATRDIIRLALDGADVITMQEMGSGKRRQAVRAAVSDCSECPFDAYMPPPAMQGAVPILYRWEKYRLVGSGSQLIHPATKVGSKGAGPDTIAAKYVNWVRLRDRVTGKVISVVNSHAVASVQNAKCRPNTKNGKRLKLYRKHMDALRSVVSTLRSQGDVVFTSGDFNVNYRCDRTVRDKLFPAYNLSAVGMTATYALLGVPATGTHKLANGGDTRVIDQIWFTQATGVTPTAQRILMDYASDHRPVSVDFALTK